MTCDPEALKLAVTVLVAVWDRAVALLKSGTSSRETEFREIVEPLYRELQPIAADYFELFARTYQEVEQFGGKRFATPLASLRKRRAVLRSARIQVRSRAAKLAGLSKDEALSEFLSGVVSFIESPLIAKTPSPGAESLTTPIGSRSAALMKGVEVLSSKNTSKNELLSYIGAAIEEMERSWASVGAAYARVQARYLGQDLCVEFPTGCHCSRYYTPETRWKVQEPRLLASRRPPRTI